MATTSLGGVAIRWTPDGHGEEADQRRAGEVQYKEI